MTTYKCQTCDQPGTFAKQGPGTKVIVLSCGHHYTFQGRGRIPQFADSTKTPHEYFGDKLFTDHQILNEIPDGYRGY